MNLTIIVFSCRDLSSMRTWSTYLIIIPCSIYLFLLDLKTLHDSSIHPGLRAVSESSLGAFLKASSSSRGGEQATLFNLPRWSSYLCHYCWSKRTCNNWSWTSCQLGKGNCGRYHVSCTSLFNHSLGFPILIRNGSYHQQWPSSSCHQLWSSPE